MNRNRSKLFFFLALFFLSAPLEARINVLEPWYPGLDTSVGDVYSYQAGGSFLAAERTLEVPFYLSYVPDPRLEAGGRWGVKLFEGKAGINDLLMGLKYRFMQESDQAPAVIGEAAVSLPTGDSKNGLGTGSVDLLLHWALQKQIQQVTGYFGLGMRLNSENGDNVRQGSVFFYHAGAGYDYRPGLRLYGELKGFNHAEMKVSGLAVGNSSYQELYLAPGADYTCCGYVFSGALLIGLTPESNDLGLLVSTRF
jgi:hypothetical protein